MAIKWKIPGQWRFLLRRLSRQSNSLVAVISFPARMALSFLLKLLTWMPWMWGSLKYLKKISCSFSRTIISMEVQSWKGWVVLFIKRKSPSRPIHPWILENGILFPSTSQILLKMILVLFIRLNFHSERNIHFTIAQGQRITEIIWAQLNPQMTWIWVKGRWIIGTALITIGIPIIPKGFPGAKRMIRVILPITTTIAGLKGMCSLPISVSL